tara:strand:+ start:44 stop:697 length:654 start_codon:yes stop_codon:yes gene_type:complete
MNKKTILVVAAHPDDELLGCGGALRKHVVNGDTVIACIICEGESHRNISQKGGEFTDKAADIIGISKVVKHTFPDQKLDTLPLVDIISVIEKLVKQFKPNIVYTHHGGDINKDHKILFEALLVATRPMLEFIEKIYAFETLSSTEWGSPQTFIPDTWIDITDHLDVKLDAMRCYETEVREYPHPRSIKAIKYKAYSRGSEVCMKSAEAFMTIRSCVR